MSNQQNEPPANHPSSKPILGYSNLSTTRITAADLVLRWIAAVGCIYLLSQVLAADSYSRRILMSTTNLPRLGPLQEIDAAAREAQSLGEGGNLLVSNNSDPTAVSMLHPRAVYVLWPTRLYAVTPDTSILDSAQIGPATRPSDPAWLEQHNVRATVRFEMERFRVASGPFRVTRVDSASAR